MTLCSDEKPKLYPGAWVSAVQVTDDYIIQDFPTQNGQANHLWLPPYNEYDVISQGAEARDTLDGGRTFIGNRSSKLPMVLQTAAQLSYWNSTVMDGLASRRATVYRFNRLANAWETVWVILRDKLFEEQFERSDGGTQRYELDVITQQTAPVAPELALTIDPSTTLPATAGSLNYTFTVDNVGDFQTFDTTTVLADLPRNSLWGFIGVVETGWDVEYSTNGGGSYASTLPSPSYDTTNLRLTYDTPIAAAGSADFLVQGTVTAAGPITVSGTASHPLIDSVNDSNTLVST
jgi:hypothetical protein